jgi:hypothetical protein
MESWSRSQRRLRGDRLRLLSPGLDGSANVALVKHADGSEYSQQAGERWRLRRSGCGKKHSVAAPQRGEALTASCPSGPTWNIPCGYWTLEIDCRQ